MSDFDFRLTQADTRFYTLHLPNEPEFAVKALGATRNGGPQARDGESYSLLAVCSTHADDLKSVSGPPVRVDICASVNRVQRHAKTPRPADVKELNKSRRWMKRQTSSTVYCRLLAPIRPTALTDAAHRADETYHLALRTAIAVSVKIRGDRPGNSFHLLDFYRLKQSRANQSTYSAERNSMLEAVDLELVLSCFATRVPRGTFTARGVTKTIRDGTLRTTIHTCLEAVTVTEISVPAVKSMILAVRVANDYLQNGRIRGHRMDTLYLLADASTNGSVSRGEILKALQSGVWRTTQPEQHHVSTTHV